MEKINVRITLMEAMLGTSPNNAEIYREFFAPKAPNDATADEEAEALAREQEGIKGMTVFPRNEDGKPFIYDYMIKGAFKDACQMLARLKNGNESSRIKAFKKIIDGLKSPSCLMERLACASVRFAHRPRRASVSRLP